MTQAEDQTRQTRPPADLRPATRPSSPSASAPRTAFHAVDDAYLEGLLGEKHELVYVKLSVY